MDTAQWPQEIVLKPIGDIIQNTYKQQQQQQPSSGLGGGSIEEIERRNNSKGIITRQPHKVVEKGGLKNCPRCNSTNTKFCYYNNYSLSQPRYFCKTCRRYWTEGGSLRNIPVGGGSRKNKRSSSTSSKKLVSSSSSSHDDQNPPNNIHQQRSGSSQDLNLAFPSTATTTAQQQDDFRRSVSEFSAMELLTGMTSSSSTSTSRGFSFNSFIPMPIMPMPMSIPDPNTGYLSGYNPNMIPMHEFKNGGGGASSLSFTLDRHCHQDGLGYDNHLQGGGVVVEQSSTTNNSNASGRVLFSFEDLKQQVSSTTTTTTTTDQHNVEQNHNRDSTGYWTGMLGGGSW